MYKEVDGAGMGMPARRRAPGKLSDDGTRQGIDVGGQGHVASAHDDDVCRKKGVLLSWPGRSCSEGRRGCRRARRQPPKPDTWHFAAKIWRPVS